jgi:flagellar biogenesis protein FliO
MSVMSPALCNVLTMIVTVAWLATRIMAAKPLRERKVVALDLISPRQLPARHSLLDRVDRVACATSGVASVVVC